MVKPVPGGLVSRCKDLLEQHSDAEVAFRVGACIQTVRKIRENLGIPKHKRHSRATNSLDTKHPGLREKLGQFSDSELAEEYHLSRERIRQIRVTLNIPKKIPQDLPLEGVKLLGKIPDSHISIKFSLQVSKIRRERIRRGFARAHRSGLNYDEIIFQVRDKVGVISDRKIAKILGIPIAQVVTYRQKHNIPPAIISPRCKNFVPHDRGLIAKMFSEGATDKEIAKELRTSKAVVSQIRTQELGLLRRQAPARFSPETLSEIIKRSSCETPLQISLSLGVSQTGVRKVIKKFRLLESPVKSGRPGATEE